MKTKKIWFIAALMALTACGNRKAPTGNQEPATDPKAVDSVTVVEKNYDLEALAEVIKGCTYLGRFSNGAAEVNKNGSKFYIDPYGHVVEKPQVQKGPDDLTAVCDKGKFGFVNSEDELVIPLQYHYACDFSDGMALVINEKWRVGYINTKGELVIPYKYGMPAESNGNDFHEGLCAVLVDEENEYFSYIDKTGELAFPGVFSLAGDFCEGLASVKTIDKYGYIDHSGKMAITLPDGWWGSEFSDGVAQTQREDSCYIIDKTGKRLFQVDSNIVYTGNGIVFSDGLAVVIGKGKYENKWGLMDKTGLITFCLAKDEVSPFDQPLTKAEMNRLQAVYEEAMEGAEPGTLTRWAMVDIDGDGYQELWLSDNEGKSNVFFTQRTKDGAASEWTLLGVVPTGYNVTLYPDRICGTMPAGGPAFAYYYFLIEKSLATHVLAILEVYGEVDEASLDGTNITAEEVERLRSTFKEEPIQSEPRWQKAL